jgi:hypothetical protein
MEFFLRYGLSKTGMTSLRFGSAHFTPLGCTKAGPSGPGLLPYGEFHQCAAHPEYDPVAKIPELKVCAARKPLSFLMMSGALKNLFGIFASPSIFVALPVSVLIHVVSKTRMFLLKMELKVAGGSVSLFGQDNLGHISVFFGGWVV